MNLAMTSGKIGLAALAVITSTYALADQPGWYAGASAGQSASKIDDVRITSGLLGDGFSTNSITDRDLDHGYKIFGGYRFNRNFAVEGGYFDLGKFGFTANTMPAGTLNGNIRLKGLNLDVVGTLPITERFSAFGRIGVNRAEAMDEFTGTGAVNVINPNPSQHDTNPKIGLGIQYDFTDALAMRAEVERYRISDAVGNRGDIDLISVGLIYHFGGKTPAPVAYKPMAEPVAVVPEPAPVVAAAPPPPMPVPVVIPPPPPPRVPTRVTFSADSLFDFDKATVKPEGKQHLDKFAADLRGVNFDVIKVTGHTDRIGPHAYNVKLSTRRAEMVQAYLVESAGLPASKIEAKGVNGSDPVTKPGECTGKMAVKERIACLQADRRVDVEVSGTK